MSTRHVLVDINDNVIGHQERGKTSPDDIFRVTGLWLTNSKGEILLAQRKWTKKNDPGKWGPAVAGTVEVGETYLENMRKEAEEELGLRDLQLELGPKYLAQGTHNRFYCQWYRAQVDKDISEFRLEKEEVEAIRWMSVGELLHDMAIHPETYIIAFELGLQRLKVITT